MGKFFKCTSILLRLYLFFQDIGMMDQWKEHLLEDLQDLEEMKGDLIILMSKLFLQNLTSSLVQTFYA